MGDSNLITFLSNEFKKVENWNKKSGQKGTNNLPVGYGLESKNGITNSKNNIVRLTVQILFVLFL